MVFIYELLISIKNKILYIYMSYCQKIYQSISKCWDNYTWFSMVAMNGEEGDRRYKDYKLSKKKTCNNRI